MWLAVMFSLILAAVLVALIMQRQRGRGVGGAGLRNAAQFVQGVITVTGVSERPEQGDAKGERFCTLSGTIIGPQTDPTEVYGTFVLPDAQPWPQVGTDLPVVYKPGKAETTWRLGELPPAPTGEGPVGGPGGGPSLRK